MTGGQTVPVVSVVIPCRNEVRFIGPCLDSIVRSDYPKERLEVLVVDGRSEDGTRAVVEAYRERHPWIHLLDNPARVTPVALNIGIRAARGAIVVRMDVHSHWAENYITECQRALEETGADCVGGMMVTLPRGQGRWDQAVAVALSHPFGVGNSAFRTHTGGPRRVDTVFGGAYRREVFADVGLFNEALLRSQDIEFSLRMRRAGKRVVLVPGARCYYWARSDLRSFLRHNWANGFWAVAPFLYASAVPVRWRHLVPLGFILALLGAAGLTLLWPSGGWVLAGIAGVYAVAAMSASVHAAWRHRDLRLIGTLPGVFAALHLTYGLGSLAGAGWVMGKILLRRPASRAPSLPI